MVLYWKEWGDSVNWFDRVPEWIWYPIFILVLIFAYCVFPSLMAAIELIYGYAIIGFMVVVALAIIGMIIASKK
jgi:hypothetical protein